MEELTQRNFLILHLLEDKKYGEIADEYKIDKRKLTEWWDEGNELRELIKKSNLLFSSKKGNDAFSEFKDKGKKAFYEWYSEQPRTCAYCGIEEFKLNELFENGHLHTKRGRGKSLELERKNSLPPNLYSKENCVLVCYLCNNHKSDLITESDHRKYFVDNIRKYLEDKYTELKNL